jgi:type IV pilus assembly protein PilC
MAEFLVKIADDRGRLVEQVERGVSESEIRDRFVQQGFLVYWVKPRGMLAQGQIQIGTRRLKQGQFVIFNQQFLTLIKAGLPILASLELLIKRQKDSFLRSLLENVHERVKSGESLSDAFAAQGAFPKIYTTNLMAGEKSGNIEEVLGRYIAFQRMSLTFKKKLIVSLVYPSLLVVVVIFMLIFLITFVVPQFAKLFQDFNAKLPASTLFMLQLGDIAQHYGLYIAPCIPILLFLFWRWKRTERGAALLDLGIMHFPMLGQIWLKHQVSSFARMLSTLLAGGLALVPSLETAGASLSSRNMVTGIAEAAVRVREGQTLAKSLEEQNIFPDLSVEMIEVGESTGALPTMLNSVAEFYEEDVQTALGAAMALIEPLILVFMAIIVGTILISLYMPIFTIGSGSELH